MSAAAGAFRRDVRRVVVGQALLALLVAVVFWYYHGAREAVSAVYGGAIAVFDSWWLGRGVGRAAAAAHAGARTWQWSLYAGAALRFIAAIGLLALGLGAAKLAPLPLVVAFAVAQIGFLAHLGRA